MNRAIDSAAAQKRRVRRVYDGVNLEFGDVAAGNPYFTFCHVERSETSLAIVSVVPEEII
jgi:hypothetical protein